MAFTYHEAQTLIDLYNRGGRFRDVLTLGRSDFLVDRRDLRRLLAGAALDRDAVQGFLSREHPYADPLFVLLGAEKVDALDASAYEGANVIHNLNEPVPQRLKEQYDLVYDGGTLEHVFNFPLALKACMEMARVGGYVMTHNPANNMGGHGFYQISPELYHRAFGKENGFAVESVIVFEAYRQKRAAARARVYDAADPVALGRRIHWSGTSQMIVQALGRRVRRAEIFAAWPQQTYYAALCEAPEAGPAAVPTPAPAADAAEIPAAGFMDHDMGNRRWLRRMVSALDSTFPRSMELLRTLYPLHWRGGFALRRRGWTNGVGGPRDAGTGTAGTGTEGGGARR